MFKLRYLIFVITQVCLYAQLSRGTFSSYCPCPSMHAPSKNLFIVQLCYDAPFSWLLFNLILVGQTSYKQVSEQLVESISNSENFATYCAVHCISTLYTLLLIEGYKRRSNSTPDSIIRVR